MNMRMVVVIKTICWLMLLGFIAFLGLGYTRNALGGSTTLDLADPVGLLSGRKLVGLTDDARRCEALLARAGVRFVALPPVRAGRCGYADGVRLTAGGSRRIGFSPAGVGTSCAVAAGLALWEWHVVQPAALRHFGQAVTRIDHYGSYACRRIGGGATYSEHATADAIDVAGFRLDDGRTVGVLADWNGTASVNGGAEAAFLHEVRDGACGVFSTVLGPDYNAAHRDHLHLDQAERGAGGWRGCR